MATTHEGAGFHSYEPRLGHRLPHNPFTAIVAPRPIGWISTISAAGIRNLAPYSYFNALSVQPPLIGFSSHGWKDSVRNASETGEFVWNLATRELAERMNATSARVPDDEFELAGLAALSSTLVRPERVAESPVSFECRVADIVTLRTADGTEANSWFVVGEVVMVHIREDALVDGQYDTAAAQPIMRAGGPADYFGITAETRFQLRRPGP